MADTAEERPTPPYCSWGTLLNMFDRMEKEGVPARIDKSYMRGMAGGTQAQVKQALRSLALTDESGVPTPALQAIATQPDQRPALIADVLRERFAPLVALPENATRGQLDETLAEVYDQRGDTARKAVAFFVSAATYAGIPLSNEFKPKPGRPLGNAAARKKPAKKKPAAETPASPPVGTPPADTAHSRSVTLASGGTVTVSYSVDLFDLSDKDRTFVLGLIDALRNYKATGKPSAPAKAAKATPPAPDADADSGGSPAAETRDADAEGT